MSYPFLSFERIYEPGFREQLMAEGEFSELFVQNQTDDQKAGTET